MAGGAIAVREAPSELVREATLDELSATIHREHEACRAAMQTTVEHAIRAGEALLQVRERLAPRGEWIAWLGTNFPKHRSQAYTYMRIATYQHLVPAGYGVTAADRLAKGLPAISGGRGRPRIGEPVIADAARMREEGASYKQIAKQLDVSVSTVHGWFNGGSRASRDRRARKALRHQEQRRAIKRAVTKEGGALAEAYSMAERLDDVLGQASREATDPEARRELAKAHELHRAMRDAIVRGLGVSK
jgi:transposase-like protein